jgi:hypothetical protein
MSLLLTVACKILTRAMGKLDERDRTQEHTKQELAEIRSRLRQLGDLHSK